MACFQVAIAVSYFNGNPFVTEKPWYFLFAPTLLYLGLVLIGYILLQVIIRQQKKYYKEINKHKDSDEYFC